MPTRLSGSILLTITLVYAFIVVFPAYARGVYHLSDFRAKGFYDVPTIWSSNHPLVLILAVVPVLLGYLPPGGHLVLIAFLSCGLIFPLILDWKLFASKEKLLWLSVLIGSWIFFYISSEIIEIFRIWLLD
jgi:hypothetical protein